MRPLAHGQRVMIWKQKGIANTELFPGLCFLDCLDGQNLARQGLDAVHRGLDI